MAKLKSDQLRWNCDKNTLSFFKNFDSLPSSEGIVGQKRAVAALDIGLKLYKPGYNIYVAGLTGTGKLTTIRRSLKNFCPVIEQPPDRCYVYNFVDSSNPVLLNFRQGQGRAFKEDIDEMIGLLKTEVPKALESEAVTKEKELIVERYQREEKHLFADFSEKVKTKGFTLLQVQEGGYVSPAVFVMVGEEAVSIDFLDQLVKEEKMKAIEAEEKRKLHKEYTRELKEILTRARSLGKGLQKALEKLLERSGSTILDGLMDDLHSKFTDKKVRKYLLRMKNHILKNIEAFAGKEKKQEGMIVLGGKPEDPFWLYEVNLLIDQSQEKPTSPCPLVEELNPSFTNLFGAIEYHVSAGGAWSTDFRYIKAGSLLRADGGFLIINALDILKRPFVWDQLKRVLKKDQLTIQPPEYNMAVTPMALKPEAIDLKVKVIMIGPSWVYHLLYNNEEDFAKTFKVLADFDTTMPLNKDNASQYAAVLKAVCDRGEIKPFAEDGLAALIEYGVEEAGQQNRLSTKFAQITDVLRESDYWAGEGKSKTIKRDHVEKAINQWKWRHSLSEETIQRMIDEGTIMIDSKGKRIGQVNGLAVYSMGHATFGKPSRITASVGVGKSGIINIEREAKLSGPTHDKGVLIISGFLRKQYAHKMPLTLSASLGFEQSYSGVDGDSASSTELYCLISALSEIPISQEFAVTGSINQMGDIQPIGGANEKIEGFYDVCNVNGLTGKQGVIIPKTNEKHLMLRKDVVKAVKKGKFHIYSISNIDEGIEILMNTTAGKLQKDGTYPKNSVHGKVLHKLEEMADAINSFGKPKKKTLKPKKKVAKKKVIAKRAKPAKKKKVVKAKKPKKSLKKPKHRKISKK